MPTISIFLRNEDLEKWKAIPHKSEWMHVHLKGKEYKAKTPTPSPAMKVEMEPKPRVKEEPFTHYLK